MEIFETIVIIMVALVISLILIGLGVVYGAESEKGKCYHEMTKMIRSWNEVMPQLMRMYEKMMKMYDEE